LFFPPPEKKNPGSEGGALSLMEETTTTVVTTHTTSKMKRKTDTSSSSSKKAKKANEPRQRTDTYWAMGPKASAGYFDQIFLGTSPTYELNQEALVKLDANGKEQKCWRIYSQKTGQPSDSILSVKAYRVAFAWSIYSKPELWSGNTPSEEDLEKVKTKTRDHTCHRCGIDWCCNPLHLRVDSRTENETDKHYHYFLNHQDSEVRDRFRITFADLLQQRGLW